MIPVVPDALVVCESDVLRGLVVFAVGRYASAVRAAAGFEAANDALVKRAPSVAIVDADMSCAETVAHLTAPGTLVIAVNAGAHTPTWADAAVRTPFRPSGLYDALEAVIAAESRRPWADPVARPWSVPTETVGGP